jgi:ferric-dicitrate binding protein FerR (iron transport regulator)
VYILTRYALVLLTMSAFAASPVASVRSSADFELRGVTVNTAGVPSWPVMAGDLVTARKSPAVIQLEDGSRVTLAVNSRAKIEETKEGLSVRLMDGSMAFVMAANSSARFYSGETAVKAVANVETAVSTKPVATKRLMALPPPPGPPPKLSRY